MGQGVGELNVGVTARTTKARKNINEFRGDVRKVRRDTGLASKGMNGLSGSFDRGAGSAALMRGGLGPLAVAIGGAVIASQAARFAINSLANSMERIDKLAKTSRKLGIGTEELAGLRLAAEETGVAANTLDMGLQRMVRRVSEAAIGTGEAQGALKELGIDAKALNALSPDQQFAEIARAMGQVSGQADKVRLGFKLFDSEGVALVNTLAIGKEGLDEAAAAARQLGIAVSAQEAAKIEKANDALGRMGKAGEGLANELAISLTPALIGFADKTADAIRQGREFVEWLGLAEDTTSEAAVAAQKKAQADEQAAAAAARNAAAQAKVSAAYQDQIKAIQRQRMVAELGEDTAQFRDNKEQFGLGKALVLQERRESLADFKAEQDHLKKVADLRKQVEQFGYSDSDKQRANLFGGDNLVDPKLMAEANRLFDQLEKKQAAADQRKKREQEAADQRKKREQEAADQRKKREQEAERKANDDKKKLLDLEREVAMIGKTDAERRRGEALDGFSNPSSRARGEQLFDRLENARRDESRKSAREQINQRGAPGILNARSAEGFAALRKSLNASGQQKLIDVNREGNELLSEINEKFDKPTEDNPFSIN